MTKVSKDGINFHEIVEDFDTNTGVDKSLAAAQAKGYKPYVDVSKDGQKVYTIEGSADSLQAAQTKGYKLAETFKSAQAAYDKEKSSQLDSAEGRSETRLRGMAQGLTGSFADEAQAGLRSAFSDKSYKELRDDYRHDDDLARKVNPGNMLGAEIGSSLLTGGGAAKTGLSNAMKTGVLLGGANAVGASEKEDIIDIAKDGLHGAAIGAAIPLAFKGAEKIYTGGKKLAGMAIRGATDTSQEMLDRALIPRIAGEEGALLSGSELIKAAPKRSDIVAKFEDNVAGLRKEVTAGSNASRDILQAEATAVPASELVSHVNDEIIKIKDAGVFTNESKRTLGRLEEIKNNIIREAGDSNVLSGNTTKNLIQDVQEYGFKGGNPNAADFGKSDANTFKSLRASFDNTLKSASPNYESKMAGVAENTGLLKDTKKLLNNPQATIKRQLGTNSSDKNEAILNKLGMSDDIELQKLKSYFASPTTNGSRKTVVGGAVGSVIGVAAGHFLGPLGYFVGREVGDAAGKVAGAAIDKHGRMMALKAFELAKKLEPRAAEFGKYTQALSDAAAKGPAAFLMTHSLLVKHGKIEE